MYAHSNDLPSKTIPYENISFGIVIATHEVVGFARKRDVETVLGNRWSRALAITLNTKLVRADTLDNLPHGVRCEEDDTDSGHFLEAGS